MREVLPCRLGSGCIGVLIIGFFSSVSKNDNATPLSRRFQFLWSVLHWIRGSSKPSFEPTERTTQEIPECILCVCPQVTKKEKKQESRVDSIGWHQNRTALALCYSSLGGSKQGGTIRKDGGVPNRILCRFHRTATTHPFIPECFCMCRQAMSSCSRNREDLDEIFSTVLLVVG